MLRAFSAADIGQTLVLRGGIVLAVEAIEGTNACIQRAGELGAHGKHPLGAKGLVVVKGVKQGQDTRLDLPTIGPETIVVAKAANVSAIAVESGSTLLVAPGKTIKLAEEAGIALIGVDIQRSEVSS